MTVADLLSQAQELTSYGWVPRLTAPLVELVEGDPALADGGALGRVLRPDRGSALTALADGTRPLPVRSHVRPVTVGDWVVAAGGAIAGRLERSSLLQRRDPATGNPQLLAANMDIVAIVCGLDRPVKMGRIQRGATLAWDAGAEPVVVLTKADLAEDVDGEVSRISQENPMTEVVATSSLVADGLDALRDLARGRTLVLLGESGAGKSTLVNALLEESATATGAVRASDAKGRHTTTHRFLHSIPSGGCVIDTPGLREVGLWAGSDSVDAAFADIEALAPECRFRNCSHQDEPDCAVQEAVASGDLAAERLDQFHTLHREAASAALRASEHERRAADRRFGRMVKEAQRMKNRP